jgi:hypothetical protein
VSAAFDIDFVTSHFSTCDLIYYLDLIRSMSNDELRALRAKTLEHQRSSRSQQAFADVENMSTHQAITKAINHELLRRSFAFRIAVALFPVRKFIVETFSGLALRLDDRFGVIYSKPKFRRTIWHLHHNVLLSGAWRFIVRNERTIFAATLTGIGALIARYFI